MFKSLIFASLLAAGSAHQNFHQFWVNDVSPGFEVGVRMPPSNSPVVDVTSNDIVCNVPGTNAPAGGVATVPVAAGDKITVQWDQSGHPGPISHMLFGPVDSAALATGVGEWFKIDELTSVDGKWANEIMGAAEMKHTFTLPANLASGEYLLRSEMLALHGANTIGGAQFYIGCAQIKVTGPGGTCGPKITLPGAYDPEEAGIYIPNVYNGFDLTTYAAPGGDVAICASGSGGSAPVATSKPAVTSDASSSAVASSVPVVSSSVSAPSSTAVEETLPETTPSSTAAIPAITPVSTTTLAQVSATLAPVASSTKTACKVKSSSTAVPVVSAPSSTKSACKPKATSTGAPATLPSSTAPVAIPSASAPIAVPSASAAPASSVASIYAQCGGINFTGPIVCATGSTCLKSNDFYSQCVRAV